VSCDWCTLTYQGLAPRGWKKANIVPAFKKGDRANPSNYPQISLTSLCSKVTEHAVHSNIMKHLEQHNILTDQQHGFRKGRSSRLIITVNDFAKCIDDSNQIDAILLDFLKAFDKVSHSRLLLKLKHWHQQLHSVGSQISLTGVPKTWYLMARRWITCYLRSPTRYGPWPPAVPCIYINDLPTRVSSTVWMFADDCLLYCDVHSMEDTKRLLDDFDSLHAWEHDWLMEFNPSKCEAITFTKKTRPVYTKYAFHDQTLATVSSARYLGVYINSKLSWNTHIDTTAKNST